jgi:hypothetical protein
MTEEHGQKVLKALEGLEERRGKILDLGQKMVSAYGGSLYPVDLLAIGAIKRIISMSGGIKLLVNAFNMVCARSLLRLHIDTALRFFAVFLVKEPHDLVMKVMSGEQINSMEDTSGKKMTDAYLLSKLASEYSWLPNVYKNLSGYVHFSDQHLVSPVQNIDTETRYVQYVIHEKDTKYPEFSWVEVVDCFNESTDIFIKYLEGWIFTKSNPEIVGKLKKELNKPG